MPPAENEEAEPPIPLVALTDTAAPFFWNSDQIHKQGSLTRGITTGSNRGLSLTSGLQLQLEGDLGNGLRIEGAISDENIPIQPEGTTQQLADFDRIFLRLSKDPHALTLGDYEVSYKHTRFAGLYRNVQGVRYEVRTGNHQVRMSGAVAKGQFHTNSFIGKEGVSGPYRLQGRNNERFFFILAGSERVYLNGKLLTRGAAFDYTINYNTAEITFTARHVINRASRIVVDFEYNDRNYNRSLLTGSSEHRFMNDRLSLAITYSRDADNPHAPFDDPTAFAQVKDSLAVLGDADGNAFTSGVFEAEFDANTPRYARRDTAFNDSLYERYIFSTDSLQARYQVFFTFVGAGQGMYEKDQQGINQNVFVWVGPDRLGNPQGSYAPIRKWVLPQSRQVLNTRAKWQLNKTLTLTTETSVSAWDKNRLSSRDDADNLGLAHFSRLDWAKVRMGKRMDFYGKAEYQHVQAHYHNLDRIYKAEYDRLWDIPDLGIREDEEILLSSMGISLDQKINLEVEGGMRNTGTGQRAYRQVYRLESNLDKGLTGDFQYTRIEHEDPISGRASTWQRQEGNMYTALGKSFQSGVEIWMENKQERFGDSLGLGNFRFWDFKPYIRTAGTHQHFQLEASVNYRKEEQLYQGSLLPHSLAYTYSLTGLYRPSPEFQLQHTSSYRTFEVLSPEFLQVGLEDAQVFLSHIQGQIRPKRRFLRLNWVYDVNAEQISRQELRFIEVSPGLGQYEWIDINDNAIQEVNEFQLSTNPLIANYIKVSVPTQEQVPASQMGLSSSMQWNFKPLIAESTFLPLEVLRHLRMFTQLKVNQNKVRQSGFSQFILNPGNIFADSSLLRGSSFFKHDWTFFQNHPTGDIKLTYFQNRSKQFLSTGDEWRSREYWQVAGRYNMSSSKSLEMEWERGNTLSKAEILEGKNFDIEFWELSPRMNFQLSNRLRLSGIYGFALREEQSAEVSPKTRIQEHKFELEGKLNFNQRNTLLSELTVLNIKQEGTVDFLAGYELRQGFEPGLNTRWRFMLNTFLFDNLALNFTYEGRTAPEIQVIHTARVQLRALF